jgi:hypothetical protein
VADVNRRLDEPLVTWNECVVGQDNPEGVVVALPHNADRLDVGLAIAHTEWGGERMPEPGDVTIRKAWARLLTLREQWWWQREAELPLLADAPAVDPPADWFPDESIPSWIEDPHGEEVWIVTW